MNKKIIASIIITIIVFPIFLYILSELAQNIKDKMANENNICEPEIYGNVNLTEKQYYILASIIEAEAHWKSSMPKISAVFHNRLNRDMKLQSCATVNFVRQVNGLPFKLHLSESDTDIKSPCNTYLNYGLPPFPICIPSKEAIRASYNPYPDTKLLFFRYDKRQNRDVFSYTYRRHKNL